MKHTFSLWVISAVLIGFSVPVVSKTVEGTQIFSFASDKTVDAGCGEALSRLKLRLIENACGSILKGAKVRLKSESVDQLNLYLREDISGYITKWGYAHKTVQPLAGQNSGLLQCAIKASFEVTCRDDIDLNQRQPLSASLSESVIKDGQTVRLEIGEANKGRFIHVFVWMPYLGEHGRLTPLLRNELIKDKFSLPVEGVWEVGLPVGKTSADEALVIISSAEKLDMKNDQYLEEDEFFRWLLSIPAKDRREVMLPYQIVE